MSIGKSYVGASVVWCDVCGIGSQGHKPGEPCPHRHPFFNYRPCPGLYGRVRPLRNILDIRPPVGGYTQDGEAMFTYELDTWMENNLPFISLNLQMMNPSTTTPPIQIDRPMDALNGWRRLMQRLRGGEEE